MPYAFESDVRAFLTEQQDLAYRDFMLPLILGVDAQRIMGVRTPELRRLAKKLARREDIDEFLSSLPHDTFEEMQLHAFVIGGMRDYDRVIGELDRFLPFVDNWATCDQLLPKVLARRPDETIGHARRWIADEHTYTVRFGIGVLMKHFLGERFDPEHLQLVASIESEEYYINMMRAWYVAEALAKQPEAATVLLENGQLDRWTHNKAIQKACESRRVDQELKEHLRTLRR